MPGGSGRLEVGRRVFFDDYYLHHRLHSAWLRKMLKPGGARASCALFHGTPRATVGKVLSKI